MIEQAPRHVIEQAPRHVIEQAPRHVIEQAPRHVIEQVQRHVIARRGEYRGAWTAAGHRQTRGSYLFIDRGTTRREELGAGRSSRCRGGRGGRDKSVAELAAERAALIKGSSK